MPVVATCSNVTHAIARSAMNAGVDQLWNFPLKPAVVSEGLEALALRRPPFVVTTDYMGPDRRKNAREGRQIPRIDVPNKMRQALFDENPEASTTAFRRLFDRLRVERQVEQVAWLKAKFDRPGADVDAWVDRLSEVAEDVRERIPRTRHRGHHGLSQRLLELSVGMKKGVTDERRAALAALCREMEGSIQPVVGLGDSGPQ